MIRVRRVAECWLERLVLGCDRAGVMFRVEKEKRKMGKERTAPKAVFGKKYSAAYDLLYRTKDYEAECDFVISLFRKRNCEVRSILDLGCGTGGHAIPLALRGYEVTGVDRSSAMLARARQRADEAGARVEFVEGDIRNAAMSRTYDAVISMFAVMGYQVINRDLAATCRTARRHLRRGGMFVFDVWHGNAVLLNPPTCRILEAADGQDRVIRFTEPVVNHLAHTVEVRFKLWRIRDGRLVETSSETHFMRYIFPQEIAYMLEESGLEKIGFCPFLDSDRALSSSDWNMAVFAQAVEEETKEDKHR